VRLGQSGVLGRIGGRTQCKYTSHLRLTPDLVCLSVSPSGPRCSHHPWQPRVRAVASGSTRLALTLGAFRAKQVHGSAQFCSCAFVDVRAPEPGAVSISEPSRAAKTPPAKRRRMHWARFDQVAWARSPLGTIAVKSPERNSTPARLVPLQRYLPADLSGHEPRQCFESGSAKARRPEQSGSSLMGRPGQPMSL